MYRRVSEVVVTGVHLMESSVSVLKFGGTSVGSGERIRRVAHIIAHHISEPGETFPIVVVSAMSAVGISETRGSPLTVIKWYFCKVECNISA